MGQIEPQHNRRVNNLKHIQMLQPETDTYTCTKNC